MASQPPVAEYNLSALARDELARIVARKQRGNLRGSELNRQIRELDSTRLKTPCTFMMYDFEQHKRDRDEWLSKPFYTAPQGYKMNLSVYANGNGDGAGTHVSVYLQLMPGEFDDRLRWPFRGSFVVKLFEQSNNGQDIQTEISFSSQTPRDVAGKPTYKENRGWGRPEFVAQRNLGPQYSSMYSSCWSWWEYPVYIDPEEDSAYFQVTKK